VDLQEEPTDRNCAKQNDCHDQERAAAILSAARLPVLPPSTDDMPNERFLALMAGDKKVQAGKIRLVLLKAIGQAYVTGDYPPALLERTLTEYR